ncbi:DNA-formamidopyrimidine glycosylase [Patescibacteria group bacterium]|nr:DNA-formamidopyrimidine glycosylase [Patescibacteria group bacterium]
MPELPEVETIKRQLVNRIQGKRIQKIEIKLAKMIKDRSVAFFKRQVIGTKIKGIKRRGKLIIINLSNDYSLVIHLKLSGQLIYQSQDRRPDLTKIKYNHLVYYFSDGSKLFHNDLRQFGYVKLVKTVELKKIPLLKNYGPEPLKKDFTLKKFNQLLELRPRPKIKPLLMDQGFIAGIGNIYAQEICWCSQVLPDRLINSLSQPEIKKIYACLIKILKRAIKDKGTSDRDYIDARGQLGKYAAKLKVYGRKNKKCRRCRQLIKKIALAGRGTCYCPGCQK